jgi:transposase
MFKEYNQQQLFLLPPDLSELVPEDHLARVINDIVDKIDIRELELQYSEIGQNGYHPRMMLKVIFYRYATGVRSSRKLAQKLREGVIYMWLSGMQRPDFRTLALFRQQRLQEIKKIFTEIVKICMEMGMVKIGKVYIDGTKIEANASGHRMIYLKSTQKARGRYRAKDQNNIRGGRKKRFSRR